MRPRLSDESETGESSPSGYLTDESFFDDKPYNESYHHNRAKRMVNDMRNQLFIPSDYQEAHFLHFTPIEARRFLRAMLAKAPWCGIQYVSENILNTESDDVELQRLAARWYYEMVVPLRALGEKSKSEPLSGNSPLIPSYDLTAMQAESSEVWFPEELKKREDFKTSIGRCYIEGALQGAFPEAGHIIPVSVNRKSKKLSELASNWDIIKAFSGIDPADFADDNINKLSNAILFDANEHRMFDQFDFCLKQSLSAEHIAIPNQYVVRVYRRGLIPGAPKNGTVVRFIDYRNQEDTQDLPNPKYLALHAAIAGIIHMSGAAEHIDNILRDMDDIHVLASDGSTMFTSLFMAHSAHKLLAVH